MSNLGSSSPRASGPGPGVNARPEPTKPSELSLGMSALVQVGSAIWFLRRVRIYVDPFPSMRVRCRAYLEHRDGGASEAADLASDAGKPLAVELVGDGATLGDAFGSLLAQILPACRLLQLGNDAAAVRRELENTCPDCFRPNDAHAASCAKRRRVSMESELTRAELDR